ncbi:MAG: outer membrane protein assembly factor BamD [Marinilabiliales bacterium]|nr:MAG: outer membrane protein assembly factor BamD [Marinilabiliales bacterium]
MYLCKMFKNKLTYFFLSLAVVLLAASCSDYQKLLKSTDYELKFEKAVEYYEKEDYYRSQSLLEELRSIYRGTEKAEKISYYTAYCSYGLGELSLAAYLFKDFAAQYPSSEHVEEVEFLAAYCYYLISPEESLEQAYTHAAIAELQIFIEKYPESEKRTEAEELIDKLQFKLETKAFNNAYLYFNIGDYKAAITSMKLVLADFPDTKYREDILFTIVKSSYMLAENSVIAKKKERYKNTIDAYFTFVDNFPESKNLKEAEKFYNNSLKYIDN